MTHPPLTSHAISLPPLSTFRTRLTQLVVNTHHLLYCHSVCHCRLLRLLCKSLLTSRIKSAKSRLELQTHYIFSSLLPARVFVHCAVGVSRSASLVLAYLMIHHHYTLLEAINKVKEHRWIFPNTGFLKQLRALDIKLRMSNSPHLQNKQIFYLTDLTYTFPDGGRNQSMPVEGDAAL